MYITNPYFTRINHFQELTELTEEDKRILDKDITIQECNSALKLFKSNKSLGCDGLSKEFYENLWERLGPILIEVYNYLLQTDTPTNTQGRGIITLLHKKGNSPHSKSLSNKSSYIRLQTLYEDNCQTFRKDFTENHQRRFCERTVHWTKHTFRARLNLPL